MWISQNFLHRWPLKKSSTARVFQVTYDFCMIDVFQVNKTLPKVAATIMQAFKRPTFMTFSRCVCVFTFGDINCAHGHDTFRLSSAKHCSDRALENRLVSKTNAMQWLSTETTVSITLCDFAHISMYFIKASNKWTDDSFNLQSRHLNCLMGPQNVTTTLRWLQNLGVVSDGFHCTICLVQVCEMKENEK